MDFLGLDISASGLTAQRLRMDIIASNIANANTTRTPEGGPYRRKVVIFEEQLKDAIGELTPWSSGEAKGVRVSGIVESKEPPRLVYDPAHPDADERGYVAMPNVSVVKEMTDMISASRAYEANLMVMNLARTMLNRTLDILRV